MKRKKFPAYASAKKRHLMTAQKKHKHKPGLVTLKYQDKINPKPEKPVHKLIPIVIIPDKSVIRMRDWTDDVPIAIEMKNGSKFEFTGIRENNNEIKSLDINRIEEPKWWNKIPEIMQFDVDML